MREVAMIMAAALAIFGVASTQAVAPAISGVATTNTSWWRLALAAPAISPDFALLSKQPLARPERPSGLGPRYDTRPANVSETSIIFIKIPKCSSSTAGGVARRVASRHGHVGFASQLSRRQKSTMEVTLKGRRRDRRSMRITSHS